MLIDLLYVVGSGLAIFLLGANVAFVASLGRLLAPWFIVKLVAINLLMIYMCLSLFLGHPGTARAALGSVALCVDVVALGLMWYSIEKLRKGGVTGLIPIARLPK